MKRTTIKRTTGLKRSGQLRRAKKKKATRAAKKRSVKSWRNECDQVRSKIVRFLGYCELCDRTDKQLHDHHLIGRGVLYYRYNFNNALCLCASCHTLSNECSAHGAPRTFSERMAAKLPEQSEWWDSHRHTLHYGHKMNWPVILEGLKTIWREVETGRLAVHELREMAMIEGEE